MKIQYEYKHDTLRSYLDKKLSVDSYMINSDIQGYNKSITHHKGQSLTNYGIREKYKKKNVKFDKMCIDNLKDDTLNHLYPHIQNNNKNK